jgi:cytochrome c biogenesis protein CcdA
VLSLALAVVAIALPDCVNPSLIGGEVLFGAGEHPGRRTALFAVAAFVVTFVVGLALALGLGDLILSVLPKPGPTVKYALITGAGIVLLAGGVVLWTRRKALAGSTPEDHDHRRSHAPRSPVLLGSGIAALEVLTAFPYFAAIALIVGSNASGSGKVFLLVLYCVVYAAPLFGIAAVCAVMGSRAEAVLGPVVGWVLTRWPTFVAPLAVVVGIGLTAYGIVRLSSG